MKTRLPIIFVLIALCLQAPAQTGKTYTVADYQHAADMLGASTGQWIDNFIQPQWLPNNKIWYRSLTDQQKYVLFNPADGKRITANTRKELFDQAGAKPPLRQMGEGVISPDGKYTAFIRTWNLWVKENATGNEKQLTTDGIQDFGYATDNAGWKHTDNPVLTWSPDSKKIATFQQDQRHVSNMYLVKTKVGAPELSEWKYPIPGDADIIRIYRVIIEVSNEPKIIRLKMNSDARRSTQCDDISCDGGFDDVAWSEDSKQLVFVSTSRDHKQENVRMANAENGEVKDIFEEKVATQYESGRGSISWKYFSKTNEILWYSERTDWAHLYLYNATTGQLKNPVTSGNFVVAQVLKVDEKERVIYFEGKGKEPGRNPYFRHLYRVDFTGKNLKLLTPNEGDHAVSLSPDGKYFTDSYSQANVPPVYEVRDMKGKLIATLEKTDISKLTTTGWKPPVPFSVKSADNRWDLYGLMYTPQKMNTAEKYPVIVNIYPGPQGGSVSYWGFSAGRGDAQALAELGFVVVQLEGSCNPNRSKSFHDACYGNMGENTLPDQMAGLKQLQEKYKFLDLGRVGIWGHSGGGFATAAAMFKFPDFFKVGISESGNHDNRNYEDDWGERYIGLETKNDQGISNYEQQANQQIAKNLKGKLMLVHGGMDDNVPPYNTYLVVDALIKANKDFDLVILPNARHGYAEDSNYMMRRRWDYFIQHLMGATPPKEFQIKYSPDPRVKKE
ncbi:MAG: DPP IV N-terminal domain-containing protein [Bacteroidetes bacterium]|nr:DPP IV N-terminal domain-containing protein [Bacteroidota bacterium]